MSWRATTPRMRAVLARPRVTIEVALNVPSASSFAFTATREPTARPVRWVWTVRTTPAAETTTAWRVGCLATTTPPKLAAPAVAGRTTATAAAEWEEELLHACPFVPRGENGGFVPETTSARKTARFPRTGDRGDRPLPASSYRRCRRRRRLRSARIASVSRKTHNRRSTTRSSRRSSQLTRDAPPERGGASRVEARPTGQRRADHRSLRMIP